jgi:hypothetical protein
MFWTRRSQLLYSHTVDGYATYDPPMAVDSDDIDSGVNAFETEPIYIDYTNDTTTFDLPTKDF